MFRCFCLSFHLCLMPQCLNFKPSHHHHRQPKRQRIGQRLGGDNAHQAVEVCADNKQRQEEQALAGDGHKQGARGMAVCL